MKLGHLSGLLQKIQPAIEAEHTVRENRTSANPKFVEEVARINVERNVEEILKRSPIIRELVDQSKIGIADAMYDVTSGEVQFYDHTIIIKECAKVNSGELTQA